MKSPLVLASSFVVIVILTVCLLVQKNASDSERDLRTKAEARIAELERNKAELLEGIENNAPPQSLDDEKKFWTSRVIRLPLPDVDNWGDSLFQTLNDISVEGAPKQSEWKSSVMNLLRHESNRNWCGYKTSDAEVSRVRKTLVEAIQAPWDQTKLDNAAVQFEGLDMAAKEWLTLAERSDLNWEQFKNLAKEHLGTSDAKTRAALDVMLSWFRAYEAKTQWTLVLLTAYDSEERGLERIIRITGDLAGDFKHTWGTPAGASYETLPEATRTINWKPGDRIEVYLIEVGNVFSSDRIDQSFGGAVGMWTLARLGEANWNETAPATARLLFRVSDCPGPPVDYGLTIDRDPAQLLGP